MAQFTFVTAMSVQVCLHVGYRNEPNKIEKGQLCQKLTYSQQPTGGGRVLSVILAGTLAMGMTPAVALTTEGLQPMQAFAAGVTAADMATAVLSYTGSADLGTYGGTITLPTTGFSLAPTTGDAYDANSYTIGWATTNDVTDATNLVTPANAGEYYAYAIFTADDGTKTLSSACSTKFTINKATVSAVPSATNPQITAAVKAGDALPETVQNAVTVGSLVLTTNYNVTLNGTPGEASDNQQTIPCEVTLTDETYKNYQFLDADNNPSQTANVSVTADIVAAPTQITTATLQLASSSLPYTASAITPVVNSATAILANGNSVNFAANQVTVTWKDADGQAVDVANGGMVNAGTYSAFVSIDNVTVNGVKYNTETPVPAGTFTVTKAQLGVSGPASIAAGTTMEQVAALYKVTGLQGADANNADIVAMTVTNSAGVTGTNKVAAGQTINVAFAEGTDATTAANYVLPANLTNIPVENSITIGQDTYTVSLDYGQNAGGTYYYNGAAQAPKVVLTNTNPASTTPAPVEGTDYTVYYGVGTAKGTTTPSAAVNDYQVTVQVGSGSTAKTAVAGTYSIESANINTQSQVLVTWNGQPISSATESSEPVTINDPNDWENALSIVYPTNKNAVVNPADYKVTFSNTEEDADGNISGTITITPNGPATPNGKANLTGTPFVINYEEANYQISSVAFTKAFLDADHTYTGQPQDVADNQVIVKALGGGAELTPGVDYTVSTANNTNAGTATVTVTGIGDYAGKVTTTFTIAPFDISKLTVANIVPLTFNNTAQTPDVNVSSSAIKLGEGKTPLAETIKAVDNKSKNFAVTYANNTNATSTNSPATVTITATSPNYTGSKTVNFQILPWNIYTNGGQTTAANLKYTTNSANYDADILTLTSGLTDKKNVPVKLVEGVDYEVVQNVGTGTSVPWGNLGVAPNQQSVQEQITYNVVGKGNYAGTISSTYWVTNQSITEQIQKVAVPDITFNGKAQQPDVTITLKDNTNKPVVIQEGVKTDGFVAEFTNNRDAGTATATIVASGKYGNTAYYSDQVTSNFTIKPADLSKATFNILLPDGEDQFEYTGSQIKPAISTKSTDTNLYTYANQPAAGTLKVTNDLVLNFADIATDYSVSYGANVNATNTAKTNQGTVTIAPTNGNMINSATLKFDIEPATIVRKDIVASEKGVYKLQASGAMYAEPEVTVTVNGRILTRDVDYTLTVPSKQEVGETYDWTITGIGNYQTLAPITDEFTVVNDIATAEITMPATAYVYDGNAKEPVPTITYKVGNETTVLQNGKDFKLTYKDNINAGTATVVIEGYGDDWGGKVEKTFTIAQAEGKLAITGAVADYTYTGSAATPEPNFTFTVGTTTYNKADLIAGTDYEYVYTNNIDASAVSGKKATVGVKMMGNYGAKDNGAVEFTIAQANVANAEVVVGDVVVGKTPKVAVSMGGRALVQGTDFTFSADTKTPGTKTATITGKGNYTGTQKVTFTVLNENQVPADDANLEGGTWKKTNGVWQYTTKDGKLVSSGWAKINGQYYYFDSKGNAKTGWLDDNGTWYYLNKAGEGTECAMVSNAWKKINGNWYHFAKSGAMQTGWQKINGAWYYLNKKGEGTEGAMRTGWQKINGAWYYLNKAGQGTEGAMKTGWFNDNGTWYYLLRAGEGTEGKMAANQWKQINGSWFYFYAGGAMAANTWVGNYYVDANGYWVR